MINLSKPSITNAEIEEVQKVLNSHWLGMGPYVRRFEERCRELIECDYFLSVSSCTKALEVCLRLSDCQEGDEVLVPSITYHSIIQMILLLKLVPVFVDSNVSDLNFSVEDARKRVSAKTRFVMPVHYRGRSCDMEDIWKFSEEFDLIIIEDAAHAFGSKYKGKFIGADSYAACFSFGPIKNITCGAGGGIATNDQKLAEQIVQFRNMGIDRTTWQRYENVTTRSQWPWEYAVTSGGDRCHMTDINAAIGYVQLGRIDLLKKCKKDIIQRYENGFKGHSHITLLDSDIENDFLYIYTIHVPEKYHRDLMLYLYEKGITSGIHYYPNHLQPYFKGFCNYGLKVSEKIATRSVTLPCYNDLSREDQQYIIMQVKLFLDRCH